MILACKKHRLSIQHHVLDCRNARHPHRDQHRLLLLCPCCSCRSQASAHTQVPLQSFQPCHFGRMKLDLEKGKKRLHKWSREASETWEREIQQSLRLAGNRAVLSHSRRGQAAWSVARGAELSAGIPRIQQACRTPLTVSVWGLQHTLHLTAARDWFQMSNKYEMTPTLPSIHFSHS